MDFPRRPFLAFAGVFGALGIATAAASVHLGGRNLEIAGNFLLLHAAALVAIVACGLAAPERVRPVLSVAAGLICLGVLFFCGDLASLELLGRRLFPYAAPSGGISLMAGWASLALAGLRR